MLKRLRLTAAAAVLFFVGMSGAWAASMPPMGPQNCDVPSVCSAINTNNAVINNQVTPQTMAGWQPFRNYLHNGEMLVQQRGTAAIVGATTAGCAVLSYVADRWCVDTNVTSGVGDGQVITASPAPPPGFTASMALWRVSGALTQQICGMQEIKKTDVVSLQGQSVIFSMYAQPLAALSSASGAVQAYLITGTGADQGLGALRSAVGMTASPAITPVWTGVAGGTTAMPAGVAIGSIPASPSWNLGLTAAWTRLWTQPVAVPLTATEAAVAVCFTPVGSASGATDGFAFTGAQLEVAGANNFLPSSYEHVPYSAELDRDLKFYWQYADPAATVEVPASCFVTTANTTVKCGVWLPQTMDTAPVTAIPVSASFGIIVTAGTAGTCTALAATASSNSTRNIGVTCTTAGTIALGNTTPLIGAAAASANINASADF